MDGGPQDTDPVLEDWLTETWGCIGGERSTSSPLHALVRCIAIADHSMRNAGDLDMAEDMGEGFIQVAFEAARRLGLPLSAAAFGATREELQVSWFGVFDAVVAEVRRAWTSTSPDMVG